jgi:hemerythrin-like domain-containing protein
MKPIGPLMWEHRLIERMIKQAAAEQARMQAGQEGTPGFIEQAVDFFRIYADRTHHGKEEDILFKHLEEKKLPPELKKITDELVQEHIQARKMVGALSEAGKDYRKGNSSAKGVIMGLLKDIAAFYPRHIEKEDKHFFFPLLDYFTKEEQDAMLEEFWVFDRNMIHEKYGKVVEGLERDGK